MRKISRIEPKMSDLIRRKRVAAYARVSMETERLHHSLSAQVSYYSSLIQKNPEWEYAGVFADDGISGTASAKRDAFQQMLQACEEGKIDIILTNLSGCFLQGVCLRYFIPFLPVLFSGQDF